MIVSNTLRKREDCVCSGLQAKRDKISTNAKATIYWTDRHLYNVKKSIKLHNHGARSALRRADENETIGRGPLTYSSSIE